MTQVASRPVSDGARLATTSAPVHADKMEFYRDTITAELAAATCGRCGRIGGKMQFVFDQGSPHLPASTAGNAAPSSIGSSSRTHQPRQTGGRAGRSSEILATAARSACDTATNSQSPNSSRSTTYSRSRPTTGRTSARTSARTAHPAMRWSTGSAPTSATTTHEWRSLTQKQTPSYERNGSPDLIT
jgi:hypothetical protein